MFSNRNAFISLIRTHISSSSSSRWYYTKSNQKNQASLYSKISPLGSPNVDVTLELDKWVSLGNKVRFAELQRIILDLRKRKRHCQALQVSEWMKSSGTFTFTPVQHAVQLDLIGKVHGYLEAESYFTSLSDQDKNEKVYGALLHCYVRQRKTEKALTHVNNMKEKGLASSTVAFNDIMCLYSNTHKNDKVPEVFKLMKENGVQPDNLSYRICINSFRVRSDMDGLEKILNEMENDLHIVMDWNTYAVVASFYVKADMKSKAIYVLEKAEKRLGRESGIGYNHLISLHSQLGNRDDVFRLWSLQKKVCKRTLNSDYKNMLESLVRLGELEEAGKLLKEWESSGNCFDFRIPNIVIVAYIDKGLCNEAEVILKNMMNMGKVSMPANIWCRLATGYLEKGGVDDALDSLKIALSLSEESKLDVKVIREVLRSFDEKDAVNLLKSVMPLERWMYHELLKSYITRGKDVDTLLDKMKGDNFEEDEETNKILSLKQNEM